MERASGETWLLISSEMTSFDGILKKVPGGIYKLRCSVRVKLSSNFLWISMTFIITRFAFSQIIHFSGNAATERYISTESLIAEQLTF